MSKNIRFEKETSEPGHQLYNKMIDSAEKTTTKALVEHERIFLNFMSIFLPDESDQQVLLTLTMDYIFRLFVMSAAIKFQNEDSLKPENIKIHLKTTSSIRDDDILRVQQLLKGLLTFSLKTRPSNERKKKIRQRDNNCYICGISIGTEDETEVDHVWPRSLGGSDGGENLKVAHASCAAIKADSATYGDSLYGNSVYINHPHGLNRHPHQLQLWPSDIIDKNNFNSFNKNLISSSLRIAVIMKQQYKCYSCENRFQIAGEVTLVNDCASKPSSLLNLRAYCPDCIQERK